VAPPLRSCLPLPSTGVGHSGCLSERCQAWKALRLMRAVLPVAITARAAACQARPSPTGGTDCGFAMSLTRGASGAAVRVLHNGC